MHGHSVWPLICGEVESIRPYAFASQFAGGESSQLLRTPEFALHVHPGSDAIQFFLKPEDRWEVNDLYLKNLESADQMKAVLDAMFGVIRHPGPLAYPPLDALGSSTD